MNAYKHVMNAEDRSVMGRKLRHSRVYNQSIIIKCIRTIRTEINVVYVV